MIEPCTCPIEPDGGLSRRKTLIDEKRKNKTVFLMDAGGLFAGTQYDVYTKGTEIDKARTLITIKGFQLMQYDAVALGDDEFIWGLDFVKTNFINKLPVISCNVYYIDGTRFTPPYKIIERDGIKLGIIGVTTPDILENKPELGNFIKITDPQTAVDETVKIIRKEVDYIVVLSHLGEELSIKLAEKVKGIDFIINAHKKNSVGSSAFINNTYIYQFNHQGKKLTEINVEKTYNNKISSFYTETRLSPEIKNNNEIDNLLEELKNQTESKENKIKLELFVMSYCPYGNNAEEEIYNLIQEFKRFIDFEIKFIIDEDNNAYTSLHGEAEIEEDLRQLVIKNIFRDKFWDYLLCRNNNLKKDNYKECLLHAGLDPIKIESLIKVNKEKLLRNEVISTNRLREKASPTLFINNKLYKGQIKKEILTREICSLIPDILSLQFSPCLNLPECFNDNDCIKPGMFGKCEKSGTKDSKCIFTKDIDIPLNIVYSQTMISADFYKVLDYLYSLFPGIKPEFIPIESSEGKDIINKFKINSIPVFIFTDDLKKSKNFAIINKQLTRITENALILDTNNFKITELFFHNALIHNNIQIFISILNPQAYFVIETFNKMFPDPGKLIIEINYVGYIDEKGNISGKYGQAQIEETKRQITIKTYYPEKFIKYLKLKINNLNSSYWEDPIEELGLDAKKIKFLSQNDAVKSILIDNINKANKFNINSDITIVLNNQEKISLTSNVQFQEVLDKLVKLYSLGD
ncbi:MAG: hypothetical protein HY934_04945 [Candidatus Firestonebacteria bacterium]|nr:hypothetical protein [Candidatus Firestonebacteria bacterium]